MSVTTRKKANRWGALPIAMALGALLTLSATATAQTVIRGYRVPEAQLPALQAQLQQQFGDRIKQVVDPRTKQLLVTADQAVQTSIAQLLQSTPPPTAAVPAAPAAAPTVYQLQAVSGDVALQRLQGIFGNRVLVGANEGVHTVRLSAETQPRLSIEREKAQVTFFGSVDQQRAWRLVIEALDTNKPNQDRYTQIVPTRTARPEQVQYAIQTLRENPAAMLPARWAGDLTALVFGQVPDGNAQPPAPQPAPPAQPPAQPNQPQPGQPIPGGQPTDLPPGLNPEGQAVPLDDSGLSGDVQVEFIEGLDIIILRGRRRDVERITQIIRDIDRLTGITQPVVKIRYLRHSNNEALAELLNEVYAELYAARQGQVIIRGLIKPNALLLIGRPETLQVVEELIVKLDTNVPYINQFEVFQLRHLSAVDAAQTISDSYAEPVALGTRVRVIPDFRSNSLIVQASQRDLDEIRRLLMKLDVSESESTDEVRIFRLYNAVAEELAPVLQDAVNWQLGGTGSPGGGQGGGNQESARLRSSMLEFLAVDPDGERLLKSGILTNVRVTFSNSSNSLIVTAPAESMPLLEALIYELDQLPTASAQVKVFTILNGDASRLATVLQTMFGTQSTQGGGGFGQAAGGAQGGLGQLGLQTGAGADESSLAPLRFGVDERTNSIIASGSPGDLNVIEAILLRLDEADLGKRKTTVYRLANTPAQFVADAINDLLTNQRNILSQRQQQFGLLSAYEQVDSEVFVTAEQVSNSIIISATPRYYEQIIGVIDALDRRPPMVKIDVLIAEVTLDDTEEFGVELGLQDSLLFDRSVVDATTGNLNPGFNFNNAPLGNSPAAASLATAGTVGHQALSNFNLLRTSSNLNYGGLVLSAASDSVNGLLRALEDAGRLQVLSRPQISTLDSQAAFVQVGQRVPRITDTTLTNQGTTNSVVLDQVGLILGVTPRVTPDMMVVMEVDAEKSSVGPVSEGIPISINAAGNVINSPIFDVTEAQTTISARSGQTVVFAGLITKSRNYNSRRVPYLADVPLLGSLFRFDSFQEERTELLIILTPHIVFSDEDIDWLNYTETERMSWCLADVMEVYPYDSLAQGEGIAHQSKAPVIFPDEDPTGLESLGLPPLHTAPQKGQGPPVAVPAPNGGMAFPNPQLQFPPGVPSQNGGLIVPHGGIQVQPGVRPNGLLPTPQVQGQAPNGGVIQQAPVQQAPATPLSPPGGQTQDPVPPPPASGPPAAGAPAPGGNVQQMSYQIPVPHPNPRAVAPRRLPNR